ncbi:MAG: hypothetical protein V2J24_19220 [Pseudomonadales bacterium]|jgi:hypothetical protein|nr:hypothetical protein [Pseudomonadales bacterium]
MTRVIELNDVALRLADADAVLASSPGYAVVDAKRLVVGTAAERQARLDPRHTTNQFWHRLSMDPVPHPHPSARSLADLAHAHLLELWAAADVAGEDDADVIFTLPGTLEREQIALLLGIARECPFTPVGLVDAAVAATTFAGARSAVVAHVDALLHEAVVTIVEAEDGQWQRRRVQEIPALGIAPLREAWINVIADAFVRETRFDPLHDARTEQTLFDGLDDWLASLSAAPEIEIELQSAAQVHRVALTRERVVEKILPRLAPLLDAVAGALPDDGEVLLSPRFGRLPGMVEALTDRLGRAPRTIAEDAALGGALANEDEIRHDGEALRFVTRLPRVELPPGTDSATAAAPVTAPGAPSRADAPTPIATAAVTDAPAVTHVLLGHRAWPLAGERMELGGENGLDPVRFPLHLGTLERRVDGWHLRPATGGPELPAMAPGEARVLGPAHTIVTLIRVERD